MKKGIPEGSEEDFMDDGETKDPAAEEKKQIKELELSLNCLLYTSPSPRDGLLSRMPSSA